MTMKQQLPALDDDVLLALTKAGECELREPGTRLDAESLEALVLIDGLSTVAQSVRRVSGLSGTDPDVVRSRLGDLVARGLACAGADLGRGILDPGDFFSSSTPGAASSGDQTQADTDAELLRRNGYCVNMARRSGVARKRTAADKLTVVVVDDDRNICNLLKMYLKFEGLETRLATNREEIVAAFRQAPLPDLVLLDVWLPDANGFDVLARMRQHPVLRTVPVIMVTASATREAVLKGIQGGADGYITKPFQIHPLVRAVKSVLGLTYDPKDSDWDLSL
jgi:two-component system OmpR family response regulator